MPVPRPFRDARSPRSSCLLASSTCGCEVSAPQRTPQPPRPCSTAAGAAGRGQELFTPGLRHRLGSGQAPPAPHAHSAGATLVVSCRAMLEEISTAAVIPLRRSAVSADPLRIEIWKERGRGEKKKTTRKKPWGFPDAHLSQLFSAPITLFYFEIVMENTLLHQLM